MTDALRFTTLRIGKVVISVEHQPALDVDVRVLRASDGSYRLLDAALSDPLATAAEAVARAEELWVSRSPEVSVDLSWREDGTTPLPDERPCPVCGAPARASAHHPRRLCPACVAEATDADGRRLVFGNSDLSGGLLAKYADTGETHAGDQCFVRGVPCRAEERRLGGFVVQPLIA
ncbi:MAG TPA: hypothetical protein VKZ18_12180 [Polyangia bacterium]|nr:hypothetical protein [Polyangia bacterium]